METFSLVENSTRIFYIKSSNNYIIVIKSLDAPTLKVNFTSPIYKF